MIDSYAELLASVQFAAYKLEIGAINHAIETHRQIEASRANAKINQRQAEICEQEADSLEPHHVRLK